MCVCVCVRACVRRDYCKNESIKIGTGAVGSINYGVVKSFYLSRSTTKPTK